jgi:uncharacterized iron-regulated membrane protein
VQLFSPITVATTPSSDPAGATAVSAPSWRLLLDRARQTLPDQHVARVVTPFSDTAPFHVLFSRVQPTPAGTGDLRSVYLDQYTGAILERADRRRTAGDLVMAWMAPLHVGGFGGTAVKITWAVFGLAPPLLYISGFALWWRRVVARDAGRLDRATSSS